MKTSIKTAMTVSAAALTALALAACKPEEETTTEAAAPAADSPAEAAMAADEAVAELTSEAAMKTALAGEWRVAPERDEWRNPAETLAFFGVEPGMTVVEIWPGGGWYTSVLGPYLKQGGGKLIAAGPDPEAGDYYKNAVAKYTAAFIANPDIYGDIETSVASKDSDGIAPEGVADAVLTFRNVHNWMMGEYADKMFADAFTALKPGGVLGVVEHRMPSAAEQNPRGMTGYVQEALVIQMAEEAGFELVESSEINANPKDTADHQFGVWMLPPNLRSAPRGGETPADYDAEKYKAIGESDRMTLKFRKPEA